KWSSSGMGASRFAPRLYRPAHQLVAPVRRTTIMTLRPGLPRHTGADGPMTQPAIQVQNLTKLYGPVVAVDNVSFDVAPGELVGFLGQNGAGKTTTMRILTTFMPASSGYAKVSGFDVMYQSMDVR